MTGKRVQQLTQIYSVSGSFLLPIADDPTNANGSLKCISVTSLSGAFGGAGGGGGGTWGSITGSLNSQTDLSGVLNYKASLNNPSFPSGVIVTGTLSGTLISGNTIAGGNGYLNTLTVANQVSGQSFYGSGFNLTNVIASGTLPTPVTIDGTTARTLSLADAGAFIRFTNTSGNICTVSQQSSVAWPNYSELILEQATVSGVVTAAPDTNVTLTSPNGLSTAGLGTRLYLKQTSTNNWTVSRVPNRVGIIGVSIGDGTNAVTPAVYSTIIAPNGGTIIGWTIQTDQVSTTVVDVLKQTFSTSSIPGSSIAGSDKPSVTAAVAAKDTTLSGWGNTQINQFDQITFQVTSNSAATRILVFLMVAT